MRLLAPVVVLLALLAGPMASMAEAVTLKDLIDLKKAGISDAVLVALIDSDGSVFQLTATEVRTLRDAGFSDSLIISILGTSTKDRQMREAQAAASAAAWAQTQPPPWTPPAPPPVEQVAQPEPVYGPPVEIIEPVPVFVTPMPFPYASYGSVPTARRVSRAPLPSTSVATPMTSPVYLFTPSISGVTRGLPAPARAAPVYWGWGGQPRPDGWKEKKDQ